MNKLIIFDFDGVLFDGKEIHFIALNKAIEKINRKYVISVDDHLKIYDGLPTMEKLKLLSKNKGLDQKHYEDIWRYKQYETQLAFSNIGIDQELYKLFKKIKDNGIYIAVASNSIGVTVKNAINSLGVANLVDLILSNEDVTFAKPYPEIFWKAMVNFQTLPTNTVIFEDSAYGIIAARNSGAKVIKVKNRKDLNLKKIDRAISHLLKDYNVS